MRILLINPPLTQPSGPYPAICYLAGFLRKEGRSAALADASLTLLLRLFTRDGIGDVAEAIRAAAPADPRAGLFLDRVEHYASTIDVAVRCLQRRDGGALARGMQPGYFPPPLQGPTAWATQAYYNLRSFEAQLGPLAPDQRDRLIAASAPCRAAFGTSSETDESVFRASMMIADISSLIRDTIEPDFDFDAYAESLSDDCPTFAAIAERLGEQRGILNRYVDEDADDLARRHQPDLVGFSIPFGGCLYGALRMAARFKAANPATQVVLGGGWINTQLRELSDPAIFDYADFITLDDGERPLMCILESLEGRRGPDALCRTFVRRDGRVAYLNDLRERDVSWAETGTPTYAGLPTQKYLCYRPTVQSFQRMWGTRWNKLTLAHGCYWKKCSFCDTHLDYIGRYEQVPVDVLIDRIKALVDETGETGFHFVDEAMPPALLRRLAERLVAERMSIAWFGNARFDKAFEDMAPLLAESGCIGITGGLETASPRTLALMEKGVPLEQGARVCNAFARAGIFVHAYLIYGFPTETPQETIDAMEFVRQMFAAGALHSAYWHRFSMTQFSPMAMNPAKYGVTLRPKVTHPFSNYFLGWDEPGRIDHASFAEPLRRATTQYRLGIGLDRPVESWFAGITIAMPATTLPEDFVTRVTSV